MSVKNKQKLASNIARSEGHKMVLLGKDDSYQPYLGRSFGMGQPIDIRELALKRAVRTLEQYTTVWTVCVYVIYKPGHTVPYTRSVKVMEDLDLQALFGFIRQEALDLRSGHIDVKIDSVCWHASAGKLDVDDYALRALSDLVAVEYL